MSEFFPSEKPADVPLPRRAEHPLDLSSLQQAEIIDDLTSTVDELRIFANPTSIVRFAEVTNLDLGSNARIPSSLSRLSLRSSLFDNGTYKTKLILPGQTLRLEGSNDLQAGIWSATSGNTELTAVEHADLVGHLSTILPQSEALDELADATIISDRQINDYLWNTLAPVAEDWQDSRQYSASDYTFSIATDPRETDYFNEVGAMLGYTEGPSRKRYTSRISTERPIDLSWTPGIAMNKPVTVNQEYYFHVEYPRELSRSCKTLAHLALESASVSSSSLARLAQTTSLYLDDPGKVYSRTNTLVRDAHLNKDLTN